MTDRKRIMLFGINDDEIALLMKNLSQCDFTYADVWTDIIALPADLVVANLKSINDDEISVIYDYYKQIEPSPEQIIITNSKNREEKIKSVRYVNNLFESERLTRTTILSALHDTLRDVDFSRRMVLTLKIMRSICNHPGITTKEISEMEEISERSVKRYIDTLRMSGAIIDYKERGWHCDMAVWDF